MKDTSTNNKKDTIPILGFFRTIKANKAKENRELNKWISTLNSKEKDEAEALLSVIKSGKFILILGSLCPLFWRSLIVGDSTGVVLFNLGHSVLYIIIGYVMIKRSKKSLYAMKSKV